MTRRKKVTPKAKKPKDKEPLSFDGSFLPNPKKKRKKPKVNKGLPMRDGGVAP